MPPVLLAHSYFLLHDPKQVRKMKPYPPLATLITAAVLRERGTPVALFDAMLARGEEEFAELVARTRPAVVGILEDNFNFLTKMCTTRMREACLAMVRAARAAGARVAVNGSDAADRPELYLEAGADVVILGETEATFPALADLWLRDRDSELSALPGLALAARDGVRRTAVRPLAERLDELPLPAWDLVDVERYRAAWKGAHGRLSWNVVTTRGCPFRCNWCAKPLYGTRYAQRSPAGVAEELRRLAETVAPDHVWFADDIFGLSRDWIEVFAEELAARGVRIPFTMQSRVDLMTPSAVAALARAGAEEVWMGVESGSQRILDAMEKGTRLSQVRAATRLLRRHGVKASWFLQLGYPGEGWDDILATRDLLRDERPDDVGVSVAYPLPGTKFHEMVQDQLGVQRNWTDSDDLAMMFEGTYSGPFYKKVRDLLHAEVLEAIAVSHDTAGIASAKSPATRSDSRPAALDQAWAELSHEEPRHRSAMPTRLPPLPVLDEAPAAK